MLALVLSMDGNMVCAGSAADKAGFFLPVCIFAFHQLFLKIGLMIGGKVALGRCERVCGVIAGIMLVALGIDGIFC